MHEWSFAALGMNRSTARNRCLGIAVVLAVLGPFSAVAADLAPNAVAALVKGRTWATTRVLNYARTDTWEWRADGTVCLRLDRTDGKCDDSGSWTIDGPKVCYKLEWWQKSQDLSSACFSVADLGDGQYEAKLPTGSSVLRFRVSRK